MKFSRRTDWEIAPNRLAQLAEEKKKSGQAILDLTESNPTRCNFNALKSDFLAPLSDPKNLLYEPHPQGHLEAREAVCGYYADKKIAVHPDQVFLTASTSEAYTFLFRLLCDEDDRVLAPTPSYPLFDYLSDLNDVKLQRYSLTYEQTWRIDEVAISKFIEAKSKAVIVVNPNNPTGNFVKSGEMKLLNEFCAASETAIISDEVFLDFSWDGKSAHAQSFAGNKEVLTFALSGVSKILGFPQMKLSWIVVSGPDSLAQQAIGRLGVIADTYLSVNTPSQRALAAWFGKREMVKKEIGGRLVANRKYLVEKFKDKKGVKVLQGEGGWYSILEIHNGLDDEDLALRLLERQNVFVHPGYFYGFEEGNFLVLSLLLPQDVFQAGMDKLAQEL